MQRAARALVTVAIAVATAAPVVANQQPDPNSPRYKGVVALNEFIASDGDEAVQHFIDNRIAGSVRESMGDEELAATLAAIRREAAGSQMKGGRPIDRLSAELILDRGDGSELSIEFALDEADNDRFVMIRTPEHSIG